MKQSSYNPGPLDKVQSELQAMAAYRAHTPTTPWDGLYYELVAGYLGNLLTARERGLFVATQSDVVPCEIMYAMDMVPFHISMVSCTLATVLRKQEGLFSTAKSFGIAPEVCSVHRLVAALFLQGWAPPVDAVVWSNESCDNNAKSSELLTHVSNAPGFYFDCPYHFDEESFDYLAGELGDLFDFLGRVTGTPLRWERLEEVLDLSRRLVEVAGEITELRQAIPYPADNRLGFRLFLIRWYWQGKPEGVKFYETVRDALRERTLQGRENSPRQRFRLLSLFLPPNHDWKLLDWMEREFGAFIVSEPANNHWGEISWKRGRPLQTLAQRCLADPVSYLSYSPVEKWVEAVREDARDFAADGAIFWAHIGCRQANATIRTIKDALIQMGVPCLVVDIDTNDPSFIDTEELKDRIEGFLERIEDNK